VLLLKYTNNNILHNENCNTIRISGTPTMDVRKDIKSDGTIRNSMAPNLYYNYYNYDSRRSK